MTRLLLGLIVLTAAPSSAAIQETGSDLTGVVRYKGDRKPRKVNSQIDAMKHEVEPRGDKDVYNEDLILGSNGELANALVRVKGPVKGTSAEPNEAVDLDAAGWFFKPRVVALRAGQTLKLKVTGMVRGNFHGKTRINREFNVGIARGATHEVKFTEPESSIRVKHDCCPWQVAWIHVLDHPYFAVTGADGAFKLKGLPAGEYEIEVWHELFGVKIAKVAVDGKGAATRDFVFEGK